MKSILLSDNHDTIVGLRLAGIEGILIEDLATAYDIIKEKTIDKSIAIIIITKNILMADEERIMELKLKSKDTLIIAIPDMNEKFDNYLSEYIRESIGIKM